MFGDFWVFGGVALTFSSRREGFALKSGGGAKVNGAVIDNVSNAGCDNNLRNQLLSII